MDGLLRGDYQSRMNGYATARQNGWISANDIRELENLDCIPSEDGLVKSRTGDNTTDNTYQNWYKTIYIPQDQAPSTPSRWEVNYD